MRVGYGAEEFLCHNCSFFVNMIVILRKQRGSLRGRKEASMEDRGIGIKRVHARKSGYAWKSMEWCGDRWKDRTRRNGIVVFLFILLSLSSVS